VLTNLTLVTGGFGFYTNLLQFDVGAGTTYQIRVDGPSSPFVGNFTLGLAFTAAPPNDNFADRITLVGTNVTVSGSNVGATREAGEPDIKVSGGTSASGDHTAWWTWTAPTNGRAGVTVAGNGFGIAVGVFTGNTVTNLTWVAGVNSASGTNVTAVFDVAAGGNYQVVVDSVFAPAGNYQLNLAYKQIWAADQTLTGPLSSWLPKGTYLIMSNLQVEASQTLTIEAGATLLFSPDSIFTIAGTLIANGEIGKPIRFLSVLDTPQPGDWVGLSIANPNQPQSILDHVEIAQASTGVKVGQGRANLLVSHSFIHDCSRYGVDVIAGAGTYLGTNEVQVLNNLVVSNGYSGIELFAIASGSSGATNGTRVSGNEVAGNGYAGILLSGNGSKSGSLQTKNGSVNGQVSENYIHHNVVGVFASGYDGYYSDGSVSSVVQNNLVVSNSDSGVKLDGNIYGQVVNNTIVGNGNAGVFNSVSDYTYLNLKNNLVIANGNGLVASTTITNYNTVAVSFNNVFANATNDWVNYPAGYGITTSTNRNGFPADTQMNISADPLFMSASDFHLTANSPCVNAGTSANAPATDIDGQRRGPYVDIGCDEYFIPPLFVSSALSPTHRFVGTMVGEAGMRISIEATTNLMDWTAIATLTNLAGGCSFFDDATNFNQRFYRVKELP